MIAGRTDEATYWAQVTYTSPVPLLAPGPRVIAELPERYGPQDGFLKRVVDAGVAVRPLSACTHTRTGDPGVRLVLGYAHLPPARIGAGIRAGGGGARRLIRGLDRPCSLAVRVVAAAHQ
ncbi:hypothetical protein [Streptomyces sp. NPDC001292]|uniref:hypothetical protein n=1 Tax=Streptomyces sp. NPDC001292 TaxID=3364558 RepID=UPI0036858274